LTIGARVFGSDLKIIDLVQHTPKRDKGPQLKPALNLMLPGGDVERHAHHDATDTDEEKAALSGNIADGVLPRVVTYERIQFKQATANNGKRRAAQQYFSLIVEAYAVVLGPHGPEEIRVAISRSNPVVVRGRSPGHYSDNPPEVSGPKRPAEITTSTSFLRNEQPSPTSLKSTPSLPPLPTNSTPTSLTPTIPLQNQDTEATQPSQPGVAHDLDFLASLEADFDGYQYLPFTLLDPQGKIVVPHDLFYDPHEFPDTHYANLFQSDPNMTFPNDPVATSFNTQQPADTEFTNLYQGFFDFPPQSDTTWSASTTMGRAPSNSGHISSPFPKDRSNSSQQGTLDGNWFDTFQANSQGVGYRPTGTTPFMFPQNDNNGGKWMFEFRNSSYGYFPNLPAVGDS
jgi:hypothetical protein